MTASLSPLPVIKSQEESINFLLTFYARSQRSENVHIHTKFAECKLELKCAAAFKTLILNTPLKLFPSKLT